MKKIVIHSPGNHSHLKIEDHPDLSPRKGEVLVGTRAAGVNYADVCVRWGVYASAKKYIGWPITPGFEFSGTVLAIGEGVTRFKEGDRVFGVSFFNAYASQVQVLEKHLFPVPEGFTFEAAAGFPAVFMTAYHALFQLVRLPENARILIHSAGGGVGSALVQLARAYGFHSIAVVGAPHKVDYVKGLGADVVIDKSNDSLWERVKSVAPDGLDAVLDANGHTTLLDGYRALRPTGKLIAYGSHELLPKSASGRMNYLKAAMGLLRVPRFDPLRLITDNKSVIGFNLSFLFDRDDLVSEGMGTLLSLIGEDRIRAPKITPFPFDRVADAHRLIESGRSVGKLVLVFES
jgi:NADPH:quinone reductase-like Zn-dependent oxidoreductase